MYVYVEKNFCSMWGHILGMVLVPKINDTVNVIILNNNYFIIIFTYYSMPYIL